MRESPFILHVFQEILVVGKSAQKIVFTIFIVIKVTFEVRKVNIF